MGQFAEAREAYTDIINRNLADPPSLAVATNNLIALKGTKDVSDGLKKLDRLKEASSGTQQFQLAHALDLKLSSRQKEAIYSNRLLLLLHSNKLDQVFFVIFLICFFFVPFCITNLWLIFIPSKLDFQVDFSLHGNMKSILDFFFMHTNWS